MNEKFVSVVKLSQQMASSYIYFLLFHVSSFLCPHVTWKLSSKALNSARKRLPRAAWSKEDFPRGRL